MKKLALIALIALALPATALAKGPSKALIVGPATTIRVSGAEGSATPFWRLVEATGWFEAAWGPSRLPQTPPPGELGPRYTITWTVPSSSKLRQEVYPYAKPDPVTYMPPGQEIYDTPVKGGWFVGGSRLERALLHIGVPAQPPASPAVVRPATPTPSAGAHFPAGAIAGVTALFAAALAAGATALRRRSSGAAGT